MELTAIAPEVEKEFLPSFVGQFKAPYLDKIWKWAIENITLPIGYNPPGKFSVDQSQWFIPVLDSLLNPKVRQVNLMANTRGGKSLIAEIFVLYLIVNSPGHILWINSSEKSVEKFANMRMKQLVKLCPAVKALIDETDRYSMTNGEYKFRNGMKIHFVSDTKGNLQSLGYKYIIFDEVWLSDPGMIREAVARLGDFPDTYKLLLISQGGGEKCRDWANEFERGIKFEKGWTCKRCHTKQPLKWSFKTEGGDYAGINWPQEAKKDNVWNYEEAGKYCYLRCCKCLHQFPDLPDFRNYLNSTEFIVENADLQNVDPTVHSYRVNALIDPKVKWSELVKEWLYADDVHESTGDDLSKRKFREKRLALCRFNQVQQSLIDITLEDYDSNAEWADERVRFMTVDIQEKSPQFWWLVRAWAKDGRSRLIAYGTADTWNELDSIREQHKVKHHRTFIDCGNKPKEHLLYASCAQNGRWGMIGGKKVWLCYIACKGSGKNEWPHDKDGIKVDYPYSREELKYVSLNDPKYKGVRGCPFYSWSNLSIKTTLAHLRDSKGASWTANQVCETYRKQMTSEELIRDPKTGHAIWETITPNTRNEYWDLEALQVLAATLNGLLNVTTTRPPQEKS